MNLRSKERPASLQRGKGFMYGLGLFGVGFALLLVYIGFSAPDKIPGRGYYTVQAELANGDNLAKHSQLRLNGKLVGQALNLRVEKGKALVELQIDPAYGPLKSDTRLEVRPRSPVGVRYVDIIAGTKGTPLKDGDTIPASQTKATVQLDEVLGTFDPDTRVRARQFLRALGGGFAGRGGDLNDALGAAPAFLGDTEKVMSAIAARGDAFGTLIRGSASASAAAEPVRRQIGEGFKPEADALRPFSQSGGNLKRTLENAPPAFRAASGQLPAIDGFVSELAGFAHNLRPTLQSAPTAFTQTSALLRESRPGLRAATDTLKTLGRAVSPTLTLLNKVKPVLPNVDQALGAFTPIVTILGGYNCYIKRFGENWHSGLQKGNSAGNVLHFDVITPGIDGLYGINTDALDPLTGALNNANPDGGCVAGTEYAKGGGR
jgi:ABC-type transporter Mla subunit MlaD